MEKAQMTGVPETMLQTLYARAKESQKEKPLIWDPQAIEIVNQLDYDFAAADRDFKMSAGVIARTILLDNMTKRYIDAHPEATVINIACGMDTRVYRVDNGKIRWFNLDLPETIAVRKQFLQEEGRISMIAASAMDETWTAPTGTVTGDLLVIVEGLSMYLTEQDVKQMLDIIASHFGSCRVTVFLEYMSPLVVKHVREKSIDQSGAKFTWGTKSGADICRLSPSFHLTEDRSLVEGMAVMYPIYKVIGKIRPIRNLSNKIAVMEKTA
ncbi:MAG: class I SAM-dependent methyltransferase [Clostridia bacterium]|nr:class I SAM-dependent methyltransferase [Clostridia bacterium]